MRARKPRSIACAVVVAILACASASAAGSPWVTLTDKAGGFELTVPKSLFLVPNKVSSVQAIIASLRKQKQTGVAAVYSAILAKTDVTRFWFEAFDYTPGAPVQPTVTLAIARTAKALASPGSLPALAASFAKSYVTTEGATIVQSRVVGLPHGQAAFVEATEGLGASKTVVELYVLQHGARLYELAFRTAPGAAGKTAVFSEIVRRFAFT